MKTTRLVLAVFLLAGSSLVLTTPSFAQDPHPGGPSGGKYGPPSGGPGKWQPPGPPKGPGGPYHAPKFTFKQHDFKHFSPVEHQAWVSGSWNHGWHHGRYGWWWFAGGVWFFYDEPIYPYPDYVSDYYVEEEEYGPNYPAPTWYYCSNPPGYYPYIQSCSTPWQPVPATPPPAPPGYGAPPGAPSGGPPGSQPPPG